MTRDEIFSHISGEREYQAAKWNEKFASDEWVKALLVTYFFRLNAAPDPFAFELALIKIAALCVGALEERNGR